MRQYYKIAIFLDINCIVLKEIVYKDYFCKVLITIKNL